MGARFGDDDSGDFDQLSIVGVDYGENLLQKGDEPDSMEGEIMGYSNQLGIIPEGLGIVPEGLSGYSNQMGLIPSGLGHYPQLGLIPSGLSGIMDTMNKPIVTLGGFKVTYLHLGLLAGAAYMFMQYKRTGKLLPF